ncbi:hypothetical protein GCM10023149_44240 [Mucilaginibacter gynuensis]|uniref:Lipoprotein n=1 Tax=Mucilaginibacter gynuensis TaxID=1302236 RepID=A0ABP8H8P5_9SPHI
MKKILPLLLALCVLVSCKIPEAVLGMSEPQFKKQHRYANVVEASAYRKVYKEPLYESFRFYYFKDGKLFLIDQGYFPENAKEAVPSR